VLDVDIAAVGIAVASGMPAVSIVAVAAPAVGIVAVVPGIPAVGIVAAAAPDMPAVSIAVVTEDHIAVVDSGVAAAFDALEVDVLSLPS